MSSVSFTLISHIKAVKMTQADGIKIYTSSSCCQEKKKQTAAEMNKAVEEETLELE